MPFPLTSSDKPLRRENSGQIGLSARLLFARFLFRQRMVGADPQPTSLPPRLKQVVKLEQGFAKVRGVTPQTSVDLFIRRTFRSTFDQPRDDLPKRGGVGLRLEHGWQSDRAVRGHEKPHAMTAALPAEKPSPPPGQLFVAVNDEYRRDLGRRDRFFTAGGGCAAWFSTAGGGCATWLASLPRQGDVLGHASPAVVQFGQDDLRAVLLDPRQQGRQQRRFARTVRPENLPAPALGYQTFDDAIERFAGWEEIGQRAGSDASCREGIRFGAAGVRGSHDSTWLAARTFPKMKFRSPKTCLPWRGKTRTRTHQWIFNIAPS